MTKNTSPKTSISLYEAKCREYAANLIRAEIMAVNGNRTAAAAALGIPRRTLYNEIKRLGLTEELDRIPDGRER